MIHIPKKSLGQNFLIDKTIVDQIIAAADLSAEDIVLEIGPGTGVLTERLAQQCKQVIAVEIDQSLAQNLEKQFTNQENVDIITGDILKINVPELVEQKFFFPTYKLIANIPYYITAKIIRLFLETAMPPTEMILMVQKEVAERIVAQPGQMSLLAVAVQYYADAEYLFTVPKESFDPVPEVESAVVRIARNPVKDSDLASLATSHEAGKKQKVLDTNAKAFFRVVRAGFSAKRKTLVNNLANGLQLEKQAVGDALESMGLLPTVRAQELSVEQWKKLTHNIPLTTHNDRHS